MAGTSLLTNGWIAKSIGWDPVWLKKTSPSLSLAKRVVRNPRFPLLPPPYESASRTRFPRVRPPGPTHPRCIRGRHLRGRLIPLRQTSLSRATNCREICRDLHCELGDSCAWIREVQQLRVRTNALTVRCVFRAVVSVMLQKGKSNNKRSRTFSRTRIAIEGAWHSRERVQDSG